MKTTSQYVSRETKGGTQRDATRISSKSERKEHHAFRRERKQGKRTRWEAIA